MKRPKPTPARQRPPSHLPCSPRSAPLPRSLALFNAGTCFRRSWTWCALAALLAFLHAAPRAHAQGSSSLPPVIIQGQRPATPAPPPEPPPEPPPAEPIPLPGMAVQDSRSAPAENVIGASPSASQGRINQVDIANIPYLRPPDILELVPGLQIGNHAGTIKASEYLLRGFYLDNGTDISGWIDDVPYNHAQQPAPARLPRSQHDDPGTDPVRRVPEGPVLRRERRLLLAPHPCT